MSQPIKINLTGSVFQNKSLLCIVCLSKRKKKKEAFADDKHLYRQTDHCGN